MRISSGTLKGRKIKSRKIFASQQGSNELRPTSAKVREAVFNILQERVAGAAFLDLYAGTGMVGLEAFSRGAAKVALVEKDPVRAEMIKEYLKTVGAHETVAVYREQAEYFIRRASASHASFDIIFADPPYASGCVERLISSLAEHDILDPDGCLIIEHSSKTSMPQTQGVFSLAKKYKYGDTALSLYRKAGRK